MLKGDDSVVTQCKKVQFSAASCLVRKVEKSALIISATKSVPIFDNSVQSAFCREEQPFVICDNLCVVQAAHENIRFKCDEITFAIKQGGVRNVTIAELNSTSQDLHLGDMVAFMSQKRLKAS